MEPWRPSVGGMTVFLRVTPRGGRDGIDGIETLSDGRAVLKLRVRAVADGGAANRAVTKLLAKTLRVPQASVQITSGATARLKQVAISGDTQALGDKLAAACEAQGQAKGEPKYKRQVERKDRAT